MATTDREVLTTFSAKDHLSGALNSIQSSASSALSSFTSLQGIIAGGIAGVGLGAMVHGIIEVGAQAEQTSLVLGGMLTAFGYSGDLAAGMQQASGVMESIERAAAALPGEAQEYVDVFQAGFSLMETRLIPQMNDSLLAGMREMTGEQLPTALDQMAGFSNQMTAIGRTFQIDAAQIGRDMNLMLSGRAGVGSRTFSALLPYMQQVEGQAGLTAISFNHMTDAQRVNVLVKGMAKLRPMLQGAATTWDAITGSIKTTVNQTIRGATLPIFNEVKSVAQEVSTTLDRWKPTIISVGAMISTNLVGAFHRVRGAVDSMMASNGFLTLQRIAGQGRDMVMRVVQSGEQQRGAGALASFALGGGPMGALLGATVTAFVSNTQHVETTLLALASVTGTLTGFMEPVLTLLGDLSLYLGTLTANVIPGLSWGLAMVIEGARYVATPLMEIGHEIMSAVGPQLTALGTAIGSLFQSLGSVVRPALQSFGEGLREVWGIAREYVVPALRTFVEVLQFVVEKLAFFLGRLGGSFQSRIQGMITPPRNTEVRSAVEEAVAGTAAAQQAAAERAARRTPPAARAGHNTHNDFRFSRFDITQKFAEGFDPDRVAVAFVNDIQQMANQPLRSGFDPLFSV